MMQRRVEVEFLEEIGLAEPPNNQLSANTQGASVALGPAFILSSSAPCLSRSDTQAFSCKHFLVSVSHQFMGKDPTGWLITQDRAG